MKLPSLSDLDVSSVLKEVRRHEVNLVDRIRTLVELESPSDDKASVHRVQTVFAGWAESDGGKVRRHAHRSLGDSLEICFGDGYRKESRTMLLGHLDTVWALGTL